MQHPYISGMKLETDLGQEDPVKRLEAQFNLWKAQQDSVNAQQAVKIEALEVRYNTVRDQVLYPLYRRQLLMCAKERVNQLQLDKIMNRTTNFQSATK